MPTKFDKSNSECPCGTGRSYAVCCGPYHNNDAFPATSEKLMRSRYSAFVLKKAEYLLMTWHPDTRPVQLDLAEDTRQWLGLKIVAVAAGGAGDATGTVEFVAKYKINGRAMRQTEKSRFQRLQNRWVYVDGDVERL